MKLTVDSFRTVSILQSYVGDINIAIMIVEDSHNADTYLDDKAKKDEQIKALREKTNRERSLAEMKEMKKKDLYKICKEAGISNYRRLKKKLLKKKIQEEEYSALVKQYKKKYYRSEQLVNDGFVCTHERKRNDALFWRPSTLEEQFQIHIDFLKWIAKHKSYWIYNPEFEDIMINRINAWELKVLYHNFNPNEELKMEFLRLVEIIRGFV